MPQTQTPDTEALDLRNYHPLGRLRWFIRGYVFFEGLLMALICACLWFWFTFTLDFSLNYFFEVDLLDAAPWVRVVLVTGFGALLVFFLVWYIVRRIFREFRSDALALVLEKRFPELLGGRLITAVQLVNLKKAAQLGYSVDMIKKTMLEARERVDKIPVRSAFNWYRLALTLWTLVGVSVMALLVAFPIAVLFSLLDVRRGPDLWRMLTINSLLVVGLALVFCAPFLIARSRRSSPALRGVVIGGCALALIASGVGYAVAMDDARHFTQKEYWWRFYHGTDIALARDLSFKPTRWPKDEYFVEWLDFPVPEKRIEENKSIMARAYFCRFIVPDATPGKWRPLEWRDLSNSELNLGELPKLPLAKINSYLERQTEGDPDSPVGFDQNLMDFPTASDIKVDLALAVVLDDASPLFTAAEREAFQELSDKLEARAADLKLGGRIIRRIQPPEELRLVHQVESMPGVQQRPDALRAPMTPTDGRKNVYSLEKKLTLNNNESLRVEGTVNKKTVSSSDRRVAMKRAAIIELLEYQEFLPAYYNYLPPTGPRADTIDERRNLLKGEFEQRAKVRIGRPVEMEKIDIRSGSQLTAQMTADKPLKSVRAVLKEFTPGGGGKANESRFPLKIASDGVSFELLFNAKGKPIEEISTNWWLSSLPLQPSWTIRADSPDYNPVLSIVNRPMTIDIEMVDTDNLPSSRSIAITPSIDALPNVTLFVSTIRKIEEPGTRRSYYICTARAEIPFAKESYVIDDNGIHKVEFACEYLPLPSSTESILGANLAAWLWASTPAQPSIGDFLYRREVLLRTVAAKRPDPIKVAFPIEAFAIEQRKQNQDRPPLTIAELRKILSGVPTEQVVSPVLKRFDFWNRAEGRPITFDIDKLLPNLQKKHPITNEQTSYEMILDVRATDSNVQGSEAHVGTFKDAALIFRIVPKEVLIRYIANEEKAQAEKLDEIIAKLDVQYKSLQGMSNRIGSLTPETAPSEQTRIESIIDTVLKQKESTGNIVETYARLIEEYKTNRIDDQLWIGLNEKIRDPLDKTQKQEFPAAESSLATLNVALKDGLPAIAAPNLQPALAKLNDLIVKLRQIRAVMGETYELKQLILKIEELRQEEIRAGTAIKKIEEDYIKNLVYIRLFNAPSVINVAAGGTVNVRIPIRMAGSINILPPEATLSVVEKDSELKFPAKIPLANLKAGEEDLLNFDITAGMKPGTYELIIKTSQPEKPESIKVVVK